MLGLQYVFSDMVNRPADNGLNPGNVPNKVNNGIYSRLDVSDDAVPYINEQICNGRQRVTEYVSKEICQGRKNVPHEYNRVIYHTAQNSEQASNKARNGYGRIRKIIEHVNSQEY